VNKAKHWHKHGKHGGVFGLSQEINRELRKPKRKAQVFASMGELMEKRREG